jgi:hypothetical protein
MRGRSPDVEYQIQLNTAPSDERLVAKIIYLASSSLPHHFETEV